MKLLLALLILVPSVAMAQRRELDYVDWFKIQRDVEAQRRGDYSQRRLDDLERRMKQRDEERQQEEFQRRAAEGRRFVEQHTPRNCQVMDLGGGLAQVNCN